MYYEIDLSRLPELVNIYSVRRRTVWQIVDPDSLLIFIADGRCQITTDNRDYLLRKGDMFFIPAKHHYIRRPVGNEFCTLYYAHIKLGEVGQLDYMSARDMLEARRRAHIDRVISLAGQDERPHRYIIKDLTHPAPASDELPGLYEAAIESRLKNHLDGQTLESTLAIRMLLLAANDTVSELDRDAPELPTPDPNLKLHKVLSYIRLHAKENIPLDDLCQVCNFSKQHLIRVFRSEFGKTPKAYFLEYRVNIAKELFYRNPHLSVKEVADEMGFVDQHYFTRLFVKLTGSTPSEYKRHLITFDPSKQ